MDVLCDILRWLDAAETRYWSSVTITITLVFVSALLAYLAPKQSARWNPPWIFALLILLAGFTFRWPLIFDNRQLDNPDESQIIASAIVLKSAPVFWQSVDGTTHGPLVQWPLAAVGALGARMDYTNARILAFLLVWAATVCVWLVLKAHYSDGPARLLVLPMVLLFATTPFWDFVQYSTEQVPMALLCASLWLLYGAEPPPTANPKWRLATGGILLGAVPFAKLQAAPIGLWIGAYAVATLLLDRSGTWRKRLWATATLISGALVVPLGIIGMVLTFRIWPDFWVPYIEANLFYVSAHPQPWSEMPQHFRHMALNADQFRDFFYPMGYIALTALAVRVFLRGRADLARLVFAAGFLAVSLWAIVAPNRPFFHYLQFSIAPMTLFAGVLVGEIVSQATRARWCAWPRILAAVVLAVYLWFGSKDIVGFLRHIRMPHAGQFTLTGGKLHQTDTAKFLGSVTNPDDRIALWGWEPFVLVESRRAHATREAHSALEIFESDQRAFYRARYLADLRRQNPAVFIDVTGPGTFFFEDRTKYAHETYPELAAHIAIHYRLLANVEHSRIFLRNDLPATASAP